MRIFTIFLLTIFLLFPMQAFADPEDKVRFYLATKLGYHGLIPVDIQDTSTTLGGSASVLKYSPGILSVFTIGGAGGLQIDVTSRVNIRTEIEYLYHFDAETLPMNDGFNEKTIMKLASHTLLANVFYDYRVLKYVYLYAGFGVGLSLLEADATKMRIANNTYVANSLTATVAWQLGFGARVELSEYLYFDGNFRYITLGAVKEFGNPAEVSLKTGVNSAIEMLFGLAYVF